MTVTLKTAFIVMVTGCLLLAGISLVAVSRRPESLSQLSHIDVQLQPTGYSTKAMMTQLVDEVSRVSSRNWHGNVMSLNLKVFVSGFGQIDQ